MLGCAVVRDIGSTAAGQRCVELTAFCIHPSARGAGRGDSLLDFLEQARFYSRTHQLCVYGVRAESRGLSVPK